MPIDYDAWKQEPLVVIFRTFKDGGDVIAIFPEILGKFDVHTCSSYARIGQHSACSPWHILKVTTPSSEEEYGPLLKELTELVGYSNLIIRKRFQQKYTDQRRAELRAINEAAQQIAAEKRDTTNAN